ncbi:hypothetical protein DCAR_0209484 [Daucus carota subsp. sativus]|uniref:Uncharacterized protein n=1 Tax=Daucus carota subsp. sativus TaxID=79200 RepID=A0A166FAM5_DAUCS|nr:hypothetical protein DCAR_0209484 [Daucus carota subsp. sativus]
MVLPGSNRKSSALSIEANINESVQAVPAIVRDENKCKNIIKHTTRKSSFKREGKKEIECSTKRISDAVEDFKKFSDSLMEELEADYQQMFEQMKKELENLAALPNSTMQTIDNEGEGIQNSNHVPELTRTHSEPQEQQNRSSSSNFITPAGHQLVPYTGFSQGSGSLTTTAVNLPMIELQEQQNRSSSTNFITPAGHQLVPYTGFSQGRGSFTTTAVNRPIIGQFTTNTRLIPGTRVSSLTTAVNRPAGYFTNLLRQVTNPGNLSYPHGNNAQAFNRAGSTDQFPLPPARRLGDASSFLNRNMENTSFGSSHALTYDSVPANRFRDINFFENFEMNESWLRRHGRRNGDSC